MRNLVLFTFVLALLFSCIGTPSQDPPRAIGVNGSEVVVEDGISETIPVAEDGESLLLALPMAIPSQMSKFYIHSLFFDA